MNVREALEKSGNLYVQPETVYDGYACPISDWYEPFNDDDTACEVTSYWHADNGTYILVEDWINDEEDGLIFVYDGRID